MKELIAIQSELKAPKGRNNAFGNFRYRKAEDILEAVKPLLAKYACLLTLSDDVVQIGDRFFIRATATFTAPDGKSVAVTAYAAHVFDKKGMDVAQMSGSASSYARKYALSGIFLIDDENDPDTTPMPQIPPQAPQQVPAMPQAVPQLPPQAPSGYQQPVAGSALPPPNWRR